ENGPAANTAVVGHLGRFVELTTDAVTHELPHYPVPCLLDDVLYGRGNVAKPAAWLRRSDAGGQGPLGGIQHAQRFDRDSPHRVGPRHVGGVPSVERPDIDRDHVAVFELAVARETVDDHLVDGRAQRGRKAVVALESGLPAA